MSAVPAAARALCVILVNPDADDREEQLCALREAGTIVTPASSFESARALLDTMTPDVLVTTLRLGRYNGLHLAIVTRLKHASAATIIIGEDDPGFETEAEHVGAEYLVAPVSPATLLAPLARLATTSGRLRQRRRIRIERGLTVTAAGLSGEVVNVSYEGARLLLESAGPGELPQVFPVTLPEHGIVLAGTRAWERPHSRAGIECGVEWRPPESPMAKRWRVLVDHFRTAERVP